MNADTVKNRIIAHRRLKASDLQPHPLNPRTHTDSQRAALQGLLDEIGFSRSVLAYVNDADKAEGRDTLTLIDGHLRREELGDTEIDVEILDVNDAEARALLLAIDPLAQLAGFDVANLDALREVVERDSVAVRDLWKAVEASDRETKAAIGKSKKKTKVNDLVECFQVLIECKDEAEQVALLRRFKKEGLSCKALIS